MSPSDYRYCSFCHCITNMPINVYQLGSKQLSIRLLCLSVSANTFTDIYRVGIWRGSTPVSTVLQKSVTFSQVEILSEWLRNPGKGILRCQNPKNQEPLWLLKKLPEGARPRNRLEACAFGARLGNRSVFILDPRLGIFNQVIRYYRKLTFYEIKVLEINAT